MKAECEAADLLEDVLRASRLVTDDSVPPSAVDLDFWPVSAEAVPAKEG